MAINDLGYKEWDLDPTHGNQQWRTIARFGIRITWRSAWLRRIFIMAWIPIFIMGIILFVIEQSIQDVNSDDLPQTVGRFFVAGIISQRPEINNLTVLTQWSKQADVLTGFLAGLVNDSDNELGDINSNRESRFASLRKIMRGEIEFTVKDLEFVASLSDESLAIATDYLNNRRVEQFKRAIGSRGGGPPPTVYQQSFSSVKRSRTTALELIEFDRDGNEVIDFRELVNYMRPTLWSEVLFYFFRLPQAFTVVVVIGMVAPKLISRDMKNRAFLLYYSRPITPWQYIFGKCAVVWAFLAGLTTLPAFMLYLLGLSLSPDISVFLLTWQLLFQILLASIILCIPTTLFALTLSSLTRESRLASFGWFAIWIMGSVSYGILTFFELMLGLRQQELPASTDQVISATNRWSWLSPMRTLENLQAWVFGIEQDLGNINISFTLVGLVCLCCLILLRRRVDAPIRV